MHEIVSKNFNRFRNFGNVFYIALANDILNEDGGNDCQVFRDWANV